jgi:hypothetical protein
VAMSEAISDFCRAFDLDDVPSGSSPQSNLRALGGHVRSRLHGAPTKMRRRWPRSRGLTRPRWAQARCWRPPLRWRSFCLRCRMGPGQILPRVETTPRVALPMSDPAGTICLQRVCFLRPLRPKHFYHYVIKLCFLSSRFEYQDLFVGSRIAYPSESYFLRKVMSEVSVSRRRRSPSARSTLPLTHTLTRLQDSVMDIVEKARKSFW